MSDADSSSDDDLLSSALIRIRMLAYCVRLDGVIDYLPRPDEVKNVALLTDEDEKPFELDVSNSNTVSLASYRSCVCCSQRVM